MTTVLIIVVSLIIIAIGLTCYKVKKCFESINFDNPIEDLDDSYIYEQLYKRNEEV